MPSIFDLELDDYVELEFWDHANEKGHKEDKYGLILCKARGRLVFLTADCIILQSWESILADEEDYKDNQEVYCIGIKLVTQYQTFIPWKKVKLY
jgi:hypothetical protein